MLPAPAWSAAAGAAHLLNGDAGAHWQLRGRAVVLRRAASPREKKHGSGRREGERCSSAALVWEGGAARAQSRAQDNAPCDALLAALSYLAPLPQRSRLHVIIT